MAERASFLFTAMDISKLADQYNTTGSFPDNYLEYQLDSMARTLGAEAFCRYAAKEIVRLAPPETILPGQYERFRSLVHDGIEYFLSRITYARLRDVIISLVETGKGSHPGARILVLFLHFPTLHKLGQIIARHSGLDPALKQWLIQLENSCYDTHHEKALQEVTTQLGKLSLDSQIRVSDKQLAEASVASVFPFTWAQQEETSAFQGVFKVLKPGVVNHLREELQILEELAVAFESNRGRYALHNIRLIELFKEVQEDLSREIDLAAEQSHLAEAARLYDRITTVSIPRLCPFCTSTLTAMEYLEGPKITEVELTPSQEALLAKSAFEALVCSPLFSRQNSALFHGDPHAGNILAVPDHEQGGYRVGLIDWTLAGHLDMDHRKGLIKLMIAIIKHDPGSIGRAIEGLAADASPWERDKRKHIDAYLQLHITSPEYQSCSMIKKSFRLMETMTLEGIVFPSPLLLFRKAFFTLEGVLNDISPGFAVEPVMDAYICRLVMQELPQRMHNWCLMVRDKSEDYQSLLANHTLQELGLHLAMNQLEQTMQGYATLLEMQTKLTTDFLIFMTGGPFHPVRKSSPGPVSR